MLAANPDAAELLADDPDLAAAFAAVTGASRPLSRLLETDPEALSVLATLDHRPPITAATPEQLARWKRLEELRIAARDLLDLDPLPEDRRRPVERWPPTCSGPPTGSSRPRASRPARRDRHGQARRRRAQLRQRHRRDVRRRRRSGAAAPPRPPPDRHRARLLVPSRRQPAPGRPRRAARPLARLVRGLLGALGRAVGVPGAAQGPRRRRRRPSSAPPSTTPPGVSCGHGSSPPTTSGRCATSRPAARRNWRAAGSPTAR